MKRIIQDLILVAAALALFMFFAHKAAAQDAPVFTNWVCAVRDTSNSQKMFYGISPSMAVAQDIAMTNCNGFGMTCYFVGCRVYR